ncbi:Hsp70 family protein [Alkalicoccus saliphilus]|uniref:Chaperone protein DnaK n=1 Tax=Alkalicoccus saliphilus TaxID=200989 RepID=A0A2T4U324_9BACI|nr:Hsp70 family protein [Alkalicoccus saliphilus]PTL37804.1 molecular chaperone DnaK [Alkalicoccus saliphilus]
MTIIEKNSPYILGIDLGTSNSAAAVYRQGKSEVIKMGKENTLPSVVSFRSEEEVQVGENAKRKILIDPENTVSFIKREIGTEWKKEFFEKEYRAEDISAEILSKMKELIESQEQFDMRGTPNFAVICIPANFDDNKKKATREAAQLAGLNTLYLLEEPVAASIAYASEIKRDQTILVYDLGGGTFDVSVLKVDTVDDNEPAKFSVLSKEGNPNLGGYDIDKLLMKYICEIFQTESEVNLLDLEADQGISVSELLKAQESVREASEQAKKDFSEVDITNIEIPNLIKDEFGKIHSIDIELTKDEFEELIKDIIQETMDTVSKAVENAELSNQDISRIILVGGSTRIPLVKKEIKNFFNKEPYSNIDPDIVVAQGAAIYGAGLGVPSEETENTNEALEEDQPDSKIIMDNIVTHNLGIEVTAGRFNRIIEKGIELSEDQPIVSNEKQFSNSEPNMTSMRITVFQTSEEVQYVTDEHCICIGEFYLSGIPEGEKNEHRISVKFEVNQQNEVIVSAQLLGSESISNQITIQRN